MQVSEVRALPCGSVLLLGQLLVPRILDLLWTIVGAMFIRANSKCAQVQKRGAFNRPLRCPASRIDKHCATNRE